jgi:dTDP-4-amino-4,6-dideoxygalactose transaminase
MASHKKPRFSFAASESRRLLRQRTGRTRALLAGRGLAAIWATLRALDLHDRAVLLPANTCYIVLWAVLQSGNQPYLVDIDPMTGNISPETLDTCTVPTPAVIIPAHMYGLPAPMVAICEWAKAHGAFVIEDAALALGVMADGRPAGAWGDASVFSFGRGKIADVDGGGALLTDDAALADEAARLLGALPLWNERLSRLSGEWLELYWTLHQYEADNLRLAELYPTLFDIYGEITRCRLPDSHWRDLPDRLHTLDGNTAHRRDLAAYYDEQLLALPVRTLRREVGATLWRYPLVGSGEHRDGLLQALWAQHLDVTRWYPSLRPMRAALAPELADPPMPAADQLAGEIINLPLSPEIDRAYAGRVVKVISDYFDANWR